MWEYHKDLLAEAVAFNAQVNKCVFRLAPVVEARQQFMERRPLMKRVELYLGKERLFRLMAGEIREMKDENHPIKIAGEAADVLMYGAALVPCLPKMSIEERQKWLAEVDTALLVEDGLGISAIGVAVAIARNKLEANYPGWAFREVQGETDDQAVERHNISVLGLKALRGQGGNGWLSGEILVKNGFQEWMKHDPYEAYSFLSGVSKSEPSMTSLFSTMAVASYAASG